MMINTAAAAQDPAASRDQRPVAVYLDIPSLDASIRIEILKHETIPIGSVMREIADTTRLLVHYDRNVPELSRVWTGSLVDVSLEKALDTILKANAIAFTVLGPREVFVYSDTAANRENYGWQVRVFQLMRADPSVLAALLNRQTVTAPVPVGAAPSQRIRPIIVPSRTPSPTIAVRATGEKMAVIAKLIADNDRR